jgi:predicted transcriptional regulator
MGEHENSRDAQEDQKMKTATVGEFMATDLLTLEPDMDIYDAVAFLIDERISGAPVVDGTGQLVGLMSEKDCLRLLAKGSNNTHAEGQVRDFMTKEVETIPREMDVHFAAGLFLAKPYRRFPVVENGRLVGQISRRDILKAIRALRATRRSVAV